MIFGPDLTHQEDSIFVQDTLERTKFMQRPKWKGNNAKMAFSSNYDFVFKT